MEVAQEPVNVALKPVVEAVPESTVEEAPEPVTVAASDQAVDGATKIS